MNPPRGKYIARRAQFLRLLADLVFVPAGFSRGDLPRYLRGDRRIVFDHPCGG